MKPIPTPSVWLKIMQQLHQNNPEYVIPARRW